MSLQRAPLSPYAYIAVGSLGTCLLLKAVHYLSNVDDPPTILSPLRTIVPRLSKEDVAQLPYPPDALPGRRDVITPYGTMRVYEWGPREGRKVLFLHGISTPCISCKPLADKLVDESGCRVMLFGRLSRPGSHASRAY